MFYQRCRDLEGRQITPLFTPSDLIVRSTYGGESTPFFFGRVPLVSRGRSTFPQTLLSLSERVDSSPVLGSGFSRPRLPFFLFPRWPSEQWGFSLFIPYTNECRHGQSHNMCIGRFHGHRVQSTDRIVKVDGRRVGSRGLRNLRQPYVLSFSRSLKKIKLKILMCHLIYKYPM